VPPEYDIIGPWSEVKLAILREYAAPYSKIVSAKGFHHLYIDGFAGPGAHVSRETGELILGSPRIALAIEPPFKEYHFIDADRTRVEQLRTLAGGRPDVYVHPGDCNDVLLREVLPRAQYGDFRRALCVLDPYNIDLDWQVVSTAGRMRSVEIFLNFMVMDMNMNVLLSDPEKAEPSQVARMNRFWGDESWHAVAYEEDPQRHLFQGPVMVKVEDANEKIAEAYRQRLLQVAGFKFAPTPLRFPNSLGATIYYMFFASPDPTANKIVQQIFDKYRQREWF
jgi:three-Cys-motif partner protein